MGFALAGLVLVGFLSKLPRRTATTGVQNILKANMTSHSSTTNSARHRILCYGDSLTAGTSGRDEFPYAPFLQDKLGTMAQVRWIGLPGWTADNMLNNRDNDSIGLMAALQRYNTQDPGEFQHPVSLVILLAGTNDMGHGFDKDEISSNLYKMHELCLENQVPHTIAIGIPPSGYQARVPQAAELAQSINQNLKAYCDRSSTCTFVDFPFQYERDGANWYADGLHFSRKGYQVLGEALVPTVESVLDAL